jgi:hypothetical protein
MNEKMTPVATLADLAWLARQDPRYARLAAVAASNLGGPVELTDGPIPTKTVAAALAWFLTCAAERGVGEELVVDEVNACLDDRAFLAAVDPAACPVCGRTPGEGWDPDCAGCRAALDALQGRKFDRGGG